MRSLEPMTYLMVGLRIFLNHFSFGFNTNFHLPARYFKSIFVGNTHPMFTPSFEFPAFSRRLVVRLITVICLGICTFSCQSPSSKTSSTDLPSELVSEEKETSVSFETLAGEEIALSPTNNQWTVLHFWATWCKPCLAEFPELKNALPRLATDSVQFLLASDEDLDQIDAFQKKHQTGLDLIRMKSGALADFEIYALPTTIILDKNGKEVYRHAGQLKWADISSIDQLLAEQP